MESGYGGGGVRRAGEVDEGHRARGAPGAGAQQPQPREAGAAARRDLVVPALVPLALCVESHGSSGFFILLRVMGPKSSIAVKY